MADTPDYRLPRAVEPRRYRIEISPDLGEATFSGNEEIEISVSEPVREILLNAAELEITSAEVVSADGRAVKAGVRGDEAEERAILGLPEELAPGEYVLRLAFAGTINDKLRGFYRSTFADASGAERVIATTQFEATDARRAFPCWDEPDRKAVFSVTLVIDPALAAFSNSAEESREMRPDGRVAVHFADTIRMSTYLVAFVVGPLEATDPVDVDGVALRVVHVPGKGDLCGFALSIGAHALRFFSSWFGIPYPGGKLDLIALPDFAFGAMENLGAVTFRETLLLVDESASSQVELERVADVVAHEIAHMWFGDLVTMKWWNGLWLNEAFATFMEMLCVDDFRPEWDRWVTFGLSKGAALGIDALRSTRPIEFPVGRPEEAEGMFDVLTYQKGAGVLRMLERYLGGEAFRTGIRRYLAAHSYDNAETTDLWDAIEEATGEPVRSTMDTWIFQEGYPLVTVETTDRGLRLSQARFHSAASADGGPASPWKVPVLLRAGGPDGGRNLQVLLSEPSVDVELGGAPEWAVVNAGGSGFYRVAYAPDLGRSLRARVDSLDPLEVFNLVSDTWAAALAGLGPLSELAALLRLLRGDEDPATWTVAAGALDLVHRVADDPGRRAVEGYVREVFGPAFARLGWRASPGEPDKTGTLRATLLTALGTTGADEEVRREATDAHARLLADRGSVDPDLAQALVSIIAAIGGADQYETFLSRYRHPDTPQEEIRYLYALASFRDSALAARTARMALEDVRTQNAPFVFSLLLSNRAAGPDSWEFMKRNWERIVERLPQNSIVRMLEGLSALCRPELASDIHAFFADHPVRSGEQTLRQILERLDVHVAFAEREAGAIATAFGG